jgi:DNA repair protein RadC
MGRMISGPRNNNKGKVLWKHPGGKMEKLGPETLTNSELLAVIISSGIPGKSAKKIADDVIRKFGSFRGIAGQPYEKFEKVNGLGKVKIHRLAAAFEIATRIVDEVLKEYNIKLRSKKT